MYNPSGQINSEGKKSSITNRITIPTLWITYMGVKKEPESERYVIISFDREKKEITIRKYKHDRDV
ncbi:PemI [Clostridioides difficile]